MIPLMESVFTTQWLHPYLVPFFSLSHPTEPPQKSDSFPDSAYYNVGPLDVCLVITCIAVMAILRDFFRLAIFEPFARWKLTRDLEIAARKKALKASSKTNGKSSGNGVLNGNHEANSVSALVLTPKQQHQLHRSVLRFAEQGWSAIYYPLQWTFGLYIHRNLPTKVLDPVDVWKNYPHIPLAGPLKLYYLLQTAFYLHQILILNAEARRKDHIQMMTHHVITVVLMALSYYCNFTRVGCLIMVLMDWCDIFLPTAKMFRYIQLSLACDITFGIFLVSWLITRHWLFILVILSAVTESFQYIELKWVPEEGHYLSKTSYLVFCGLLISLQVIQAIWGWMICRVAFRVLIGQGASDDRSDDEDNDDPKDD
ncbi:hypothetical protein AX16_010307 [Volvariella volvacea WC 439]|nr:hypothetical protein AX16_010307 [Volvariella volvacea WC 439]